ncbi:MAG: type II toxin-antitoxin system HicB family antitoxin [Candidatus Kapabacteria bacterium]|jgi:predicted RNase H-like HicB family nuclease|nr:type II toxin-antitoxin system HicB family antitoxin [Candidatus Kapabacteria bacterium]
MLTLYLNAALKKAHYELLPEDKRFYAEIEGFQGVYATGATLEDCREELLEVLEEWVLLSIARNLPLPAVDGIELNISAVHESEEFESA